MKRILLAILLAIGLTTAGGYAYTYSNGDGAKYGGNGMMMIRGGSGMGQRLVDDYRDNDGRYNPAGATGFGQNGWTSKQKQNFLSDTVELRKEMYEKRFAHREAIRNPKTTSQQLSKLEKEMIDLRDKIYDKAPQNQEAI